MLDQFTQYVSDSHSGSVEEKLSYVRNYEMSTEDASEAKKVSKLVISRLRQEREQRAWTQSEVAERIGTTQINISRWENGITVPSPYYRQRLGELFGKSLQELGLIPQSREKRNEEGATSSGTPGSHASH